MTQTAPRTEYDPTIVTTRATRADGVQLTDSALHDGGYFHSVLSLAVQLGVWPSLIHDVLDVMERSIRRKRYRDAHQAGGKAADLDRADELTEQAVWTGARHQGTYELPTDHPHAPGWRDDLDRARISDRYLTAEAVAYVLAAVQPPIVVGAPAFAGVGR